MELQYIIDNEQKLFEKFYTDEFRQFIGNNKVEVHFESDWQYACYINYKKGDGSWGSSMRNPLTAMVVGVHNYLKHGNKH